MTSTVNSPTASGDSPQVLFNRLFARATALGLEGHQLATLTCFNDLQDCKNHSKEDEDVIAQGGFVWSQRTKCFFYGSMALFALIFCVFFLNVPVTGEQVTAFWYEWNDYDIYKEPCLLNNIEGLSSLFRPPVNCRFCINLTSIDRVSNLTPHIFEDIYAYSGRPVVVVDGAKNWTAPKIFSFEFFKGIYSENSPALESKGYNCQFFPYQTEFANLAEVFQMDPERIKNTDHSKPWYIGWSNCDFSAANILRKHYSKPYFLPKSSESSKTDWIFMGTPGYGAHMHVDNVGNPSWQAQVTGHKRWSLMPPPECYFDCKQSLEVIVNPGEIIVLDTNIWFHSTRNVGDDLSITIGSEYD